MKLIIAFFKLTRWLNLLFIIITQCLFYYCIVYPIFSGTPPISDLHFALVVLSSVLIAAAGYIINDYFDLNIDRINKPGRMVIEKTIRRRSAIIWHWVFSLLGIALGFYVAWKAGVFWLGFANAACVIALWFYSTTFKKKLLSGNILISLLTAWTILVIGFMVDYRILRTLSSYSISDSGRILRFTFLYGGFAFIISLVREIVKDIEDMEGDERYGCRTMPIIWGVHVARLFAATWMGVLIASLSILLVYILQFRWWIAAGFCFFLIIIPATYVFWKITRAQSTADYHKISSLIKVVMFTGILSMVFFLNY